MSYVDAARRYRVAEADIRLASLELSLYLCGVLTMKAPGLPLIQVRVNQLGRDGNRFYTAVATPKGHLGEAVRLRIVQAMCSLGLEAF